MKCLFKDIRSALTPPSPLSLFLFVVLEISRQIQICSTNSRDVPLHPFSFVVGVDSWLRSWLWQKVSYSHLRHRVPYTMFFFEYSLCFPAVHSLRFPLRTYYTDIFDNPSHNSFCMPFFAWLVMCEIICKNSASGTQVYFKQWCR